VRILIKESTLMTATGLKQTLYPLSTTFALRREFGRSLLQSLTLKADRQNGGGKRPHAD